MQEMEAKVSQLSANSARLAVELGTWRKHPSDKEVVTSLLGVFMHATTGFLASKELRYKNLGKDVEKNEVSTWLNCACHVSFVFSKVWWNFSSIFFPDKYENLGVSENGGTPPNHQF